MTKAEERRALLKAQQPAQQPQTTQPTMTKADLRRAELLQPTQVQPIQTTPQITNTTNITNNIKAHGTVTQQPNKAVQAMNLNSINEKTKTGQKLADSEIKALALSKGISEADIDYAIGLNNASKTPQKIMTYSNLAAGTQITPETSEALKKGTEKISNVTNYKQDYGAKEANEEAKKLDWSDTNSEKYVEYKEKLKEAEANNDHRNISKYNSLINNYEKRYKENFGDIEQIDVVKARKSYEAWQNTLSNDYNNYLKATTPEAKQIFAQELLKDKEEADKSYKKYTDALAYDELINNNILKDTASSFGKNVLGGTANIINGLYTGGGTLTGLSATSINPEGLLLANSGNVGIQDVGNALNKLNPITGLYQQATGQDEGAVMSFSKLSALAQLHPENKRLQNLFNQIATRSYQGTKEDLANELNTIQTEIYQNFKDVYTQDELDAVAEQLRHNEIYGDLAALPNAFGTVGNMTPSILLGTATGGLGELAGAGSMATTGTIANTLQQVGSLGSLGVGAYSQGMDQALQEGANYNQAQAYGALTGATEVGTELLGGETVNQLFGRYGKTALGKVFGKAIDNLNIESKVGKFIANQVSGVASEMTEEMISEALNPLWKAVTYNPEALPDNLDELGEYFKNILNAGVEAIPSTLLMQGGGLVMQANNVQTIENGIIDSINNDTELSQIAKNQLINEVRKASREVKLGIEGQENAKAYLEGVASEKYANLSAQSEQMKQRIPEGYSLPQSTIDILAYTENNRPGLNIAFDNNIQGNGTFVENPDGTRTITLNPNSKRAVEFTLTHELGHDLKGTQEYTQLQNLLTDYAKGKPGYQEALNQLDKTYKESGANYNLQDEATNDMLGQAIGEQEFYNKLAENPTLFNRVTNGLKNLLGNKDTKLKNKIEKLTRNAYQSAYKGTGSNQVQNSLNENDRTLAATHNLTEEKLRGVLELGGFPVPSIAISKPDVYTGENFGDATVFFNKETINPSNKENEVYSRDVYSPRFPKVEYKVNSEKRSAIQKEVMDVAGGVDGLVRNPYLHEVHLDMYAQNLSDRINSFGGFEGFIKALSEKHRTPYKYLFLKETNPNFTDVLDENGKIDVDKTNKKIDDIIDQKEYENWLKDKFANIIEKKGIRNNKDYYTNTGTPRSFEALHEEYTLDNVVKIMKALNTTGHESFFMKGFNEVAGTAARKFDSIQDIKNSQDLLQHVSEENYEELLEPISNRLRDIETDIIEKRDEKGLVSNYFIVMDDLGDAIQKVARKSNQKAKLTPQKVVDIMKKEYYDIDTDIAQRIIDVIYDMKNLPTTYFEAKPQRAVGFEEIASILIPNDLSEETKQQLRDRGIKYIEYDRNKEGDRKAKYREAAQDVLFSKQNQSWQQFLDKNLNLAKGTKTNFEGLPSNEELQRAETKSIAKDAETLNMEQEQEQPVTLLESDDPTLFSLNEEQAKEVEDFVNKLVEDTTIPEEIKDQLLDKYKSIDSYRQFESLKQEITDYKDKTYKGISGLTDIADMTEESVEAKPIEYTQRKDKNTANQRKFFENVETSPIIAEETKNRVNATTYEQKKNLSTLDEVREKLDERGNDMIDEWKTKSKNFTDKDVALGAILVERYQQQGDWESAARAVEKLADMGTEAGRAVQMYSIFQRLSPETMAIYQQKALDKAFEEMKQKETGKWVEANKDKFKLTGEDIEFINEHVENASQAIDEETKQRELSMIENRINSKLPPRAGDAIKTLRRISMLFNPKTQVRNIVGNSLIMPVNDVADIIGTAIDKVISKKTGVRTTSLPNPITKAKGGWYGIKQSAKDWKTKTRTSPSGSKWELEIGNKPFNENTKSKILNKAAKGMNWINDLLSAVMSGGDRPFYEAAYKNSLEGQMKANKVKEATPEMQEIAVNEGLQRTWNDNNEYTKAVLGIRKAMNKINVHGFGLGDLIIPFAKTPANLTKAMVEYSPAGFIPSVIKGIDMSKAISRGEMTAQQQKNFVNSMSKAIAGTILYAIAGSLAKSGRLTGSADDDKDVKNFEQNVLGIQPYSVKWGDKTYTYSWANPLNAPLAIMADTYKMSKEDASTWDILTNGFKVAGDVLVENSFLQGIKELFSGDSITEGLVDAVTGMPESLIPTIASQIASAFDDTKRQTFEYKNEVGTIANKIKNKIPGARNTLAPQVNTFGEEIENQNNWFNVFFNPANVREAEITDSQKALYDVYEETKDKTIFPIQAPYYDNDDNGNKRNLSTEKRVEYQKASGQYVSSVYDDLFNIDTFNKLGKQSKVDILAQISQDGKKKAKEAVGLSDEDSNKNLNTLNEKIDTLNEANIPLADYYMAWEAQKGITGDKNANGKTIQLSASRNKKEAIDKAVSNELSDEQLEVLYGIFDISKKVY